MAGLYFEEFNVGQKITTLGRTIAESDIMTFAGLSGDYNQIHTDAEYSKTTMFGKRISHGLLGLAVASGLAMRTGIMDGTVMAFREINDWKFIKPIFIGDTVQAELNITETKALPRIGGGSVNILVEIKNQSREVCQRGTWTMLVASKPK
jgi:3-hydroxybutyryl-CoA dehydratase